MSPRSGWRVGWRTRPAVAQAALAWRLLGRQGSTEPFGQRAILDAGPDDQRSRELMGRLAGVEGGPDFFWG
jgi:hypothetical protein